MIVVLLAAAVVPTFDSRWSLSPATIAGYLAVIAVTCLVAYVFARFTERRTDAVRAWTRRLLPAARARAADAS
ncbi:hypothetical protein [Clavibacter nebraskensis]|uniref:hypothetical protein n=1 Tax=Clavibacter nebraskensis TaxID=31963 RepID=UPI003F86BCC4